MEIFAIHAIMKDKQIKSGSGESIGAHRGTTLCANYFSSRVACECTLNSVQCY